MSKEEKTTKKSKKQVEQPKFGLPKREGMQKMFGKPASGQKSQTQGVSNVPGSKIVVNAETIGFEGDGVAEANALGGAFEVVNPIPTILGPIGQFICDIDHFPLNPSMALFGPRRTGKSFSLRYIMYNAFRHIPFGCVFTRTKVNGFWQQYVPSRFVIDGLPRHQLHNVIKRQERVIEKWKKMHPEEVAKDPDCYKSQVELMAFVILDDVISDRAAMQWAEDLADFFVQGRHLCISVFICTQHAKGIGPMIRGNVDIAVLQPIYQKEFRETLQELYAGWMDKKVFFALMNDVAKDENLPGSSPQDPDKYVRTMVVNAYENTTNPQIKFRWNEAEDPGPFRLCHPVYWKELENMGGLQAGSKGTYIDVVEELEEIRMNL